MDLNQHLNLEMDKASFLRPKLCTGKWLNSLFRSTDASSVEKAEVLIYNYSQYNSIQQNVVMFNEHLLNLRCFSTNVCLCVLWFTNFTNTKIVMCIVLAVSIRGTTAYYDLQPSPLIWGFGSALQCPGLCILLARMADWGQRHVFILDVLSLDYISLIYLSFY